MLPKPIGEDAFPSTNRIGAILVFVHDKDLSDTSQILPCLLARGVAGQGSIDFLWMDFLPSKLCLQRAIVMLAAVRAWGTKQISLGTGPFYIVERHCLCAAVGTEFQGFHSLMISWLVFSLSGVPCITNSLFPTKCCFILPLYKLVTLCL